MKKRLIKFSVLFVITCIYSGFAFSDDQTQIQEGAQTQKQIYGSQLMTTQERVEFRTKMRNARTAEERENIRNEHHERMKKRAKERGLVLPDEPPIRRGHMRQGGGMGPGR